MSKSFKRHIIKLLILCFVIINFKSTSTYAIERDSTYDNNATNSSNYTLPSIPISVDASSYNSDSSTPSLSCNGRISSDDYWISKGNVSEQSPEWISYNLGRNVTICKYGLYACRSMQAPSSWTFEAWDNVNCVWVVLDSQTNVTDLDFGKEFSFNNTSDYSNYRLNVSAVISGSGQAYISELLMYPVFEPAQASSYCYDYTSPSKCFDNIIDIYNFWESYNYVTPYNSEWILYDFCQPKTISKYTIYTEWYGQAPSEWTLQGWDDIECEWITLDSQTNVIDWSDKSKEFIISNPGTFTKYRLNITGVVYNDRVRIGELILSE